MRVWHPRAPALRYCDIFLTGLSYGPIACIKIGRARRQEDIKSGVASRPGGLSYRETESFKVSRNRFYNNAL